MWEVFCTCDDKCVNIKCRCKPWPFHGLLVKLTGKRHFMGKEDTFFFRSQKSWDLHIANMQNPWSTTFCYKWGICLQGYWSRCFPVYDRIRQELRKGTLGDVRLVIANICLPLDDVPRIRQKCLGGGGLMDIGCYAVQAANIVFPGKPEKIEVQGSFFEEGKVPSSLSQY